MFHFAVTLAALVKLGLGVEETGVCMGFAPQKRATPCKTAEIIGIPEFCSLIYTPQGPIHGSRCFAQPGSGLAYLQPPRAKGGTPVKCTERDLL
jgi:hypothetical protein